MKVLVPLKVAASIGDDFDIDGTQIDESSVEYGLNEWDEYALEAAVRLSESGDDVEVVTATVGPVETAEDVNTGLAKGADRALRIWDDDLAGRTALDVGTKSRILAAVVEDEEPDLVLTGVQSHDESWSATGVSLASAVGFEWSAVVVDFEIGDGLVHVRRELEGGVVESVEVDLPAVLTIQTGINEPRYASLRSRREARRKPSRTVSLDDLGLGPDDVENQVRITEIFEPEADADTEYLEGDPTEQADSLAGILAELGVGSS